MELLKLMRQKPLPLLLIVNQMITLCQKRKAKFQSLLRKHQRLKLQLMLPLLRILKMCVHHLRRLIIFTKYVVNALNTRRKAIANMVISVHLNMLEVLQRRRLLHRLQQLEHHPLNIVCLDVISLS